jgi:hypothetical protein
MKDACALQLSAAVTAQHAWQISYHLIPSYHVANHHCSSRGSLDSLVYRLSQSQAFKLVVLVSASHRSRMRIFFAGAAMTQQLVSLICGHDDAYTSVPSHGVGAGRGVVASSG